MMVQCLEAEGVETIFGYPGAAICPFYDSLSESGIRHVLVRQEQNAAHAASGWARAAGRPGVCVATSGPGALNLITGIATAYMDSIPMVAITGQINLEQLGRDVFQEADITGACASIVKHSYLVTKAADLPRIFKEAFHIASTGRPGPVLIDVPEDVQQQEVERFCYPERAEIPGYKPTTQGHPLQMKRALQALREAQRPVICCGGGVVLAGAREEMTAFATKSGIPIVSTMMGIGVMPMHSPVYLGMIGIYGREYANRAVREADLIVLCGARVGDRAVSAPNQIAEQAKIIHIDIDPAEIGKNMRVDIPIVGDIRIVLGKLASCVGKVACDEWVERVIGYKNAFVPRGENRTDFVEPRAFIRALSEKMQEDAILVADPGQSQIWAAIHFTQREGRFLTSGGLGTMGYALPAGIGAALAKPNRQVIALCGDGAFQMSMAELSTLLESGVALKIIVFDNNALGMVREVQKNRYAGRLCGVEFSRNPDFAKLCAAYGIETRTAQSNAEALVYAGEMLRANGAFVLILKVDAETPTV